MTCSLDIFFHRNFPLKGQCLYRGFLHLHLNIKIITVLFLYNSTLYSSFVCSKQSRTRIFRHFPHRVTAGCQLSTYSQTDLPSVWCFLQKNDREKCLNRKLQLLTLESPEQQSPAFTPPIQNLKTNFRTGSRHLREGNPRITGTDEVQPIVG